jgi:ligand-binding sensor domain-containing protein/two-component sensor histidine kinase
MLTDRPSRFIGAAYLFADIISCCFLAVCIFTNGYLYYVMIRLPILAAALLLCLNLNAQMMPFKNYGLKDGLNDNNVQAVIRDDRGLLWVGTDFGVYWFDGKRFYQPQIKTNIGQLYVNGFYKDRKGVIWTQTFFNGIYKYQGGKFFNYLVFPLQKNAAENTVDEMLQVSDNKYVVIDQNCAYLFDGKQFSIFDPKNPALKTKTNSVTQLTDETIVFSTDEGVYFYRSKNGSPVKAGYALKGKAVNKIIVLKKQLWVLGPRQLLCYFNRGINTFSALPEFIFNDRPIKAITASKNEDIWAIADNGSMWAVDDTVFKIKDNRVTRYTSGNGLPPTIQEIYCDNEGLVWFADRKGLSMLGDEYYEFNSIINGRYNNPVSSLALDKRKGLWIGTVNGLAIKNENGYRFYRKINNITVGYVSWLNKDKNGVLLAGTDAGVLDIDEKSVKQQLNIHSTAVTSDTNGNRWFGGINGQVWKYNGKRAVSMNVNRAVNEMVTAMQIKKDDLWIGYRDRGIIKYKIRNDQLIEATDISSTLGFPDMRIRCSTVDSKGNLVWGTRTNGVFIFSSATDKLLAHINTENGLNANWIKDIKCGAGNQLYLATNSGINIVSGDYKTPAVKHIKINDDNINRETNYILPQGELFYIGTNEGVLDWMPGNALRDTIPPPVYFTKITIQGLKTFSTEPYTAGAAKISLPYDEHFVSLEFAGISLKNPENVLYHYILTGQDNEWSPLTDRRDVAYNLKPGSYTFKVEAENADGIWSRQPAIFHFIIKPPFWESWWFITLTVIVILLTAYSAYRYKLSKILALELLRNKISTDLHDDIGSTLSSISILSEVAFREKEQKSKRILSEINERSHNLMEKMDDIVWSISTRNDTVGLLFIRIQQFASSVLEAKDIEYEVNIPEKLKGMKLDMQRRQHIYLILKEAINNLIKYSECTTVSINAGYAGGKLKIEVTDDGKGFDPEKIQPGNGLYNMKKRTAAMNGRLLIATAPCGGTKITLCVEIE